MVQCEVLFLNVRLLCDVIFYFVCCDVFIVGVLLVLIIRMFQQLFASIYDLGKSIYDLIID